MAAVLDVLVALIAAAASLAVAVLIFFLALSGGMAVLGPAVVALGVGIALAVWVRSRRPPGARSSFAAALRRAAFALLGACALSFVASVAATAFAIRRPPQARLAASFHENRPAFETLREMVVADRLFGILHGGDKFAREPFIYRPPAALGLPPDRVAAYLRLMSDVRCERIDVKPDGSVQFAMAAWGAANHGWRMNILWSPRTPEPLVPTVDGFTGTPGPDPKPYAYARIVDEWYVGLIL